MSLRIEAPNSLYTAGQTVSGHVTLSGGQDVDVQIIKIILEGRCKTKSIVSFGNSQKTYRGRITLFIMETVLFRGPYTMKADGRWPFQFVIPIYCNVHRPGDLMTVPDANFNVDPHQPLPPQFNSDGFRGGLSTTPMIPNHAGNLGDMTASRKSAFVHYTLQAQLISSKTKFFSSGILETIAPLRFSTMRNVEMPDQDLVIHKEHILCHSLHLLPGYEDRKLTLREKLSSIQSKNVPTTAFDVLGRLPRLAVIGKPLPIFLTVQHDPASSTIPNPPLIYLRGFEIAITALTTIRTEYEDLALSQSPRLDIINDRYEIARKEWPEPGLFIEGEMDLQKIANLTIYEVLSRPPTFWTYNISRGYTLKVKADIECAKKKFHVKFTVPTFDLVPSVYRPSPPRFDAPPPKVLDEGPAPSFQADAPPAYNTAESSSHAQTLQR